MRRALQVYLRILDTHPWKVHSVQTGTLMAVGDMMSQTLVEKKKFREMDPVRIARFGAMGVVFMGPGLWAWYKTLHRLVGHSKKHMALKKVALDQLVAAPPFYAGFLLATGAMQQQSRQEIEQRFKEDYMDILINNWKLWPAVQLVNFGMVPLRFQVLFEQIFCLAWNTYLAWKTNR
ncbi:protein Mpv17-like [Cloeon dipterum]|uniref:Mitochondrial inner membrane protein Mpv17 n=1 Tax=Cloeon dipterum TaxID=197152 RepID=A0A8S1BZ46_9INSE|nr:Hypothetical predicted protein [Cloeon dipterum]